MMHARIAEISFNVLIAIRLFQTKEIFQFNDILLENIYECACIRMR